MQISLSHDYEKIEDILRNPLLFSCTYGQGNCDVNDELLSKKEWVLVEEKDEVLACWEIKELTKMVLEAHIFVLPKYWPRSREIAEKGCEWAKKQGYKVIFSTVPANCLHILKFVGKIGFTPCGEIPNGVIYNRQLTTLFLFNRQL